MSKFKFGDKVKIIGLDFYDEVIGDVIRHENLIEGIQSENYTVRLIVPTYMQHIDLVLDPVNLEPKNKPVTKTLGTSISDNIVLEGVGGSPSAFIKGEGNE